MSQHAGTHMPQILCRCCTTRHTAPSGTLLQLHALGQHAPALILIYHLNSAAFVLDLGWRGGGEAANHLDGGPTAVSRHRLGSKRRPRPCPSACPSCRPVRCPIRTVVRHAASLGAGHRRCVESGGRSGTGARHRFVRSRLPAEQLPAGPGAHSRPTLAVQLLSRPRTVHSECSAPDVEGAGGKLGTLAAACASAEPVHWDLDATSIEHDTSQKRQALTACDKTRSTAATAKLLNLHRYAHSGHSHA